MLSNGVIYEYNKSSVNDLFIHLSAVDNDYAVRLSDRTDIKEYAQKLFEKSERIEAWDSDVLVGLVAYYNNQATNSIYVSNVSVKNEFRSYGIASNLLDRLKDNVIKNNITKIVLEADDSLVNFYVKNGFTIGKQISDRSHEMEYYKDDKDIMVSICCIVYNHEPYLRQCFDGFVMQQTTFPIEILVHDDASTDHSADIIREYTEKYPDLFKPIYQTENQYSKGISISFKYQFPRAKGKYIAVCEGDDYWTDPMKLQKQVDFLEENMEYDMVCTRFRKLQDSNGAYIDSDLYDGIIREDMCGLELLHEHFLSSALPQPCTVMYRNGTMDSALIQKIKYKFDIPLYWCFMYDHRVWLINERMSVYRIHEGSVSQSGVFDTWNIYAAYLDILQYDSGNPILRKLCASSYRSCYAIPAAYRDDYGFASFVCDLKKYLSYRPTIRNVVSLVYRITIIRIKRKNT